MNCLKLPLPSRCVLFYIIHLFLLNFAYAQWSDTPEVDTYIGEGTSGSPYVASTSDGWFLAGENRFQVARHVNPFWELHCTRLFFLNREGYQEWGNGVELYEDSTASSLNPQGVITNEGNLFVAWEDQRNADYDPIDDGEGSILRPSHQDIYINLFTPAGEPLLGNYGQLCFRRSLRDSMFAYLHNVWTTPDSNIAVLFSIKSEILPDSFQTVRIQLFNPLGDPLLEENGIGLFSLPRQWDHYLLTIPTNNKLLGLSRSAQGNDRYNYVFEISMDGQVIRFPDEIHLGGYDINLSVDNLYNVIVDSMNIVYPSYYGREHILNKFNYTDDSTIWQITLTDSTYIPIRPGKPKGFYDNVNDKYLYIHRDTVEDFDYLLLDIITSGGISEVDNIQIAADQNIGDYFIQSHFCGFFVAYRVHDDDNGILLYVDSFNLLGENLWENRILLSSNSEEIEYLSVDNDDNLLVIISLIDGLYAKTISIDGNLGVTPNKVYTAKNSISTISPVKIYPSPWNNSFTVISDQSIKYVLIYNLLGKELFRVNSGDLLRSKLQITPTQDLPSGVYFLQINHGKSESLFRTVHLR